MGYRTYGAIGAVGGSWKTFPQCWKEFFVNDLDRWAYKMPYTQGNSCKLIYFNKWSCMLAFEKAYEAEKKAKRKGWKTKKDV